MQSRYGSLSKSKRHGRTKYLVACRYMALLECQCNTCTSHLQLDTRIAPPCECESSTRMPPSSEVPSTLVLYVKPGGHGSVLRSVIP